MNKYDLELSISKKQTKNPRNHNLPGLKSIQGHFILVIHSTNALKSVLSDEHLPSTLNKEVVSFSDSEIMYAYYSF